MRSSHVLCKVDDIHAAVVGYRNLGFAVELGDDPSQAINALVWFEEGPFIELIDTERARPTLPPDVEIPWIERFDRWRAQPEGWCDLALETDGDLVPVAQALREQGVEVAGPFVNRRKPPGGITVQTQTGFPYDAQLPFAMGAYQPNPRPESVHHANGATRIERIVVSVDAAALADWSKLIDAGDPWLELRPASPGHPMTVESVTLAGLATPITPSLAHGAVLRPAGAANLGVRP